MQQAYDLGGPFGRPGGNTPSEFTELVAAVFHPPDHGGAVGRPDVVFAAPQS
jgi:hypothetical protein